MKHLGPPAAQPIPELTTNQKAEIYSDALIVALSETAALIGGPDINAAIGALSFAQAYVIAKIDDEGAREAAGRQARIAVRTLTDKLFQVRVAEAAEEAARAARSAEFGPN